MSIRVRLSFDEIIPGHSKKTWFLFDPASCRLVADLEHLIQRKFDFPKTSSVNLYHEGFLLPTQEKIELVRDGDLIRVELTYFYKGKGKANWGEHNGLVSHYKPLKKQRLDGKYFEKYSSKNGNHTRKRTLPPSSSSSESSTDHEKKISGLNKNMITRKQSKTIRGHNKGLPSEQNSYKKATAGNKMLSSLESSPSSESSSSSSESSSDDFLNKNTNSSNKINDSFSSSSSSSSTSSSLSSSSSEDSSDDDQMKDRVLKTSDKDSNKNNKTEAKNDLETTDPSTKRQNKNTENLSKKSNQSKNGSFSSKEKEKDMDENSKNKMTVSLSSKKQDENTSNQSNTTNEMKNGSLNLKESKKDMDKNTKDNKNRSTSILPQNANNTHIRFDSDDEDQDISASKENNDLSTKQNQDKNSYDSIQKDSVDVGFQAMNNGEVDGNQNIYKQMDRSASDRHAAATKRTVKDYSMLPSLRGPPRVGDTIAYKILELSASYTPEMSDYKEGTVLGYNPVTNEVSLELTEDSLTKPLGDGNISTKFELIYQDVDEEDNNEARPPVIVDRKVSVSWTSMVDPKLISS